MYILCNLWWLHESLSCGGKRWQIIEKDRRKGKKSGKETCTTVPPWTVEATKEEEESQANKTWNDQPKSTTSHQEQNQQSTWQHKINQAWTCQQNYKRENWNCNIRTNTTKNSNPRAKKPRAKKFDKKNKMQCNEQKQRSKQPKIQIILTKMISN